MCLTLKFLCLTALAATSLVAKADGFTLTEGSNVIVWQLPSNPVPDFSNPVFFVLDNIPIDYDGTSETADIEFHVTVAGTPGFVSLAIDGVSVPVVAYGAVEQTFSGSTSSPNFLYGVYPLTSEDGPATLTITPEPTSFLLLGSGLLFFAGTARRKLFHP
jgi:PEP-CTERM motif